jgi:hypothetical protein
MTQMTRMSAGTSNSEAKQAQPSFKLPAPEVRRKDLTARECLCLSFVLKEKRRHLVGSLSEAERACRAEEGAVCGALREEPGIHDSIEAFV